jgi:hypothetical protein
MLRAARRAAPKIRNMHGAVAQRGSEVEYSMF